MSDSTVDHRDVLDRIVVPTLLAAACRLTLYATEPWIPRLRHRRARYLATGLLDAATSPVLLYVPAVRDRIRTLIVLVCEAGDASWAPAQSAKGCLDLVASWRQDSP